VADLVSNDNTVLRVICRDRKRQPYPLSGAVVSFLWRIKGGPRQVGQMSITDTSGGVAEYRFRPGELQPGQLAGEIRVVDANTNTVRSRKRVFLQIREAM